MSVEQELRMFAQKLASELKPDEVNLTTNGPVGREAYGGYWLVLRPGNDNCPQIFLCLDEWLGEPSLYCGFYCARERTIADLSAQCPEKWKPTVHLNLAAVADSGEKLRSSKAAAHFGHVVQELYGWGHYMGIYFRPAKFNAACAARFLADVLKALTVPVKDNIDHLLLAEGRRMAVVGTRRGRLLSVREACLESHEAICAVSECGLDFSRYGEEFAGLIEIHHTNPLSEGVRETDPVKDCVPLCPNCHRMAHYGLPVGQCRSIEDISNLICRAKKTGEARRAR